ncbi:MAG: ATP-dependent zinc metalloprotease FtsH [Gammaproteobacteria bacterium]|nr:MAG: ATP-dependent zinc metalloprotease FtsH [Gammaproteobacteria bacterium]
MITRPSYEDKRLNDVLKNVITWGIILLVLLSVFNHYGKDGSSPDELTYTDFLDSVRNGTIAEVTISSSAEGNTITGRDVNGKQFSSFGMPDPRLVDDLVENNVQITAEPPEQRSVILDLIINIIPVLLLVGLWVYFMRQMQGGGGGRGAMSFGKSKAKLQGEDQVKVTFADVAGIEEAKEEVEELVEFLRNPGKFQKLGGHIPRGVLLLGSPGTGKTLLARAIAGEAKVPFFSISGSDFVEMFVGVGASRVRDMFDQAKKHAPCIIFIDEIDAVGRHRGAGLGGGHDEREQTLNQLLVEMDGFEGGEGVIVIAATNRPDVLDPALLRPGRFDRQVVVPLPDIRGREGILKVHMRKVPMADDVVPRTIARGTPGFSGADLANLVNEAALFAARETAKTVSMDHFERAKDKIMMGTERRSMVMSEQEKKLTAYHEAGHAVVGRLVPEHDPVYKVTIIPRGRALGVTMFLPEADKYSVSRKQLDSQMASLFGGRVAEELIFGIENVTTGASNDIERATSIARNIVTRWGLSEALGPLTYSEDEEEVFLGRSITQHKHVSDETARKIDEEIRVIVEMAHKTATGLIVANRDKLEIMTEALMKYETIDAGQIDQIMEGKTPDPPKDWDENGSSGGKKAKKDAADVASDNSGDSSSIGGPAEQL